MSNNSVAVCVEACQEYQVQEITYDGQEVYVQPCSMSENLTKLAQKIDFGQAVDEQQSAVEKASFQPSLWPWDSVRTKLRKQALWMRRSLMAPDASRSYVAHWSYAVATRKQFGESSQPHLASHAASARRRGSHGSHATAAFACRGDAEKGEEDRMGASTGSGAVHSEGAPPVEKAPGRLSHPKPLQQQRCSGAYERRFPCLLSLFLFCGHCRLDPPVPARADIVVRTTMADRPPESDTPVKRKRTAIPLEVKRSIVREHNAGEKVSSLVRKYGLPQPTVSCIIHNALKQAESDSHASTSGASDAMDDGRKRVRHGAYKDVEDALYQWFLSARAMNLPVSGPILAEKAKRFAYLLRNTDFQPGGGWLQRFKERHGIVYKAVVGEAGSLRLALNLDISIRERRPAPDFKVSLLMAVQFIFAAWAEVGSSTIANCFCKAGFAGDSSEAEVEGRDAPADAEMTELWLSVNSGDGDASGLEEFLHADDAVATNEDLTDEAIVAAVTGAEDDSSDDVEEPEPMQVVSHQEALQMIRLPARFCVC
ncbi:hypothetical protein HPB52_022158 [Rhipicephalus sanguineus]|uniref:HTH CENPB-type domain-containing protein n=1 Tax=Rhipicephalus sanguineus TaxID=34632 RepID=A0A9D4QC76_RHISA|nr:hypothetical protein HPB52_022158 [Rhipicephalus sanguineus]